MLVRNFEKNPEGGTTILFCGRGSRWGPLEVEHPKRYQNRFFKPKEFDEYPLIFVWESPSGISNLFFFPGDVRSQ